jgi:hypothetical protein
MPEGAQPKNKRLLEVFLKIDVLAFVNNDARVIKLVIGTGAVA